MLKKNFYQWFEFILKVKIGKVEMCYYINIREKMKNKSNWIFDQ